MNKNYFYQKKYLANTYINRGITLTHGEGVYLLDDDNNKYLDMMSNYGVNLLGYNHKSLLKVQDQISRLITLHSSFNNDMRGEALNKLINKVGHNLKYAYFANSGTEAIEAALKFAILTTKRHKFIAFDNAFHGKTLGSLSAIGTQKYRQAFENVLSDVIHIPYNDLKSLKKVISTKIAAVIIEPIQGEGGVIIPEANFLKSVETICNENNILLIVDEIQTGLGRTGNFLTIDEAGITPDILTLGKGLAGGLPVGVTLINSKVNNALSKGIHSSTFGGNPLVATGILSTLDYLNEELFKHVRNVGAYLLKKLQTIETPNILNIRGKGLMIAIDLDPQMNRDLILKNLQQHKVLAIPAGKNAVRLLPPLIITKKEIDIFLTIFKGAITK